MWTAYEPVTKMAKRKTMNRESVSMSLDAYEGQLIFSEVECCAIDAGLVDVSVSCKGRKARFELDSEEDSCCGPQGDVGDSYIEIMQNKPSCTHCGHSDLNIRIEEGNYVFGCNDCGKSSPLPVTCAKPGHSASVFKVGNKFYLECPQCNTLKLILTEPV